MSLFGSGHSTVGAGKSGAESTKRFGPDAPWFFPIIALVLFIISPVATIVFGIGAFISQARRVRWSRITLFAAATTLLGVIAAGFNPVRVFLWHANGTISLWTPVKVFDLIQEGVDTVTTLLALPGYQMPVGKYGILSALAHTMPLAIPIGAWLAAFYAFWMAYRRAPLGNLEGDQFDWSRPEGILDRRRATSSREKILSGDAIDAKRRTVGVGVGRYGALVNICVDYMQRPTIIFGGPRQGKALALDTPIPTPLGWTTMGDLHVGDVVFDENGRPCNVTAVFDQPDGRPCNEVVFSDGSVIVADDEHLWWTQTRAGRRSAQRAQKRGARKTVGTAEQVTAVQVLGQSTDLVTLNDLSAASGKHKGVVRTWMQDEPVVGHRRRAHLYRAASACERVAARLAAHRNDQSHRQSAHFQVSTTAEIAATLTRADGGSNHSIPVAGPLDLPEQDLPVEPYTLGVWLGDGFSWGGEVFSADPEVIQRVRADGYTVTDHGPQVDGRPCHAYTIIGLKVRLREMGLLATEKGQSSKHIPTIYLRGSIAQRRAILAGLLDTDGTVSGDGQAQFDNTNQALAEGVYELAASLGYRPTIFSKTATIDGRECGAVHRVSWMTTDEVFQLERKQRLHQERAVRYNPTKNTSRYIVEVRRIPSVPVRCITVDSPNHLYLAGKAMIPTHNTMFGLGLISQAAVHGSGWLIVDFKGDAEVPAYAAAWAAAHGRKFKHFQLADKNGAPYRRPHAQAPATPACYDPLRRGNATSKTDMLVNSVGRDGDAEAYFRRAYELTQVIYQVASLTGYDRDKGGFQVLEDLLDLDHLIKVADTIGPDGRGALADHPKLRARVESMVNTVKRDDILRGAIGDMATTLSTYGNGPAAGPWLRPGTPEETINIYDAVKNGEVVVFSLSEQDYGDLAKNIGTLVLLDLQNVIAELRVDLGNHREHVGDDKAPPPWPPFYVEIEEFGAAGADAVLGVLNRSGDVQVRPFLSTQSYHDVVAVDGTGVFADRVIDQAGNIFCFSINSGKAAEVLSELTPEVTKCYPRDRKEFSGGLAGMGLKAANIGSMEVTREVERQVPPGAFQELERYHCLWIAKSPSLRVTHTYKAVANHWYEVIASVAVPPDVLGDVEVSDWAPPTSSEPAAEQPVAAYGYYTEQPQPTPPWAGGATPAAEQPAAQKPSFGPPVGGEQTATPPPTPLAPTTPHGTSEPVAPTPRTSQDRPPEGRPKFAWQQPKPVAPTPATASDEPPLPEPDLDMDDTESMEGRETDEQPTSVGPSQAGKNPPAAQPAASEQEERQQKTPSPRGFDLDGFDEFN